MSLTSRTQALRELPCRAALSHPLLCPPPSALRVACEGLLCVESAKKSPASHV